MVSNFAKSAASGVKNAATYTAGAVPVVAGLAGSAAAGAVTASTASLGLLNAIGFTAVGPVANSLAASWMSSVAVANGGAVAAGSVYSTVQAAAMGGGMLIGAPAVLAVGAVAGAAVAGAVAYKGFYVKKQVASTLNTGRPGDHYPPGSVDDNVHIPSHSTYLFGDGICTLPFMCAVEYLAIAEWLRTYMFVCFLIMVLFVRFLDHGSLTGSLPTWSDL
jgi:hypothetical protein